MKRSLHCISRQWGRASLVISQVRHLYTTPRRPVSLLTTPQMYPYAWSLRGGTVIRSLGSSSSSSSVPLSPFEMAAPASRTPSPTQEETPRPAPSAPNKSQSQVWKDLSDQLLMTSFDKDNPDQAQEQNIKECIRWWTRQRPITRQSQTYVWKLWNQYQETLPSTQHDNDLWLTVVDSWRMAVIDTGIMIRTPEQVWQEMRARNQQNNDNNDEGQIKAYGLLLNVLAQLNRPQHAQKLLTSLIQYGVQPTRVLWNTVLTAWAKSTFPEAPVRVVELLQRMTEANIEADEISYASTLEALAKGLVESNSLINKNESIQKVEEIFATAVQHEKVSPVAWLQRLQAWGAVDRIKARTLLESLRHDYLANPNKNPAEVIVPNHQLYTAVMSAFAKAGDFEVVQTLWEDLHQLDEQYNTVSGHPSATEDKASPFAPSPYTLSTVLQAFGRATNVPDRAEKAQALLQVAMEQTPGIVDRMCFNCVMDAWASSVNRQNVKAIQDLMEFMKQNNNPDLQPDTYTYNSLLKALSRSNGRDALEVSRKILKEMWQLHKAGSEIVKPNHVSYSTILHAYSRLATPNAVEDAEDIFEELWKAYYQSGDPDLLPSESAYVSLITTWIRSKRKEAPSRSAYYFDHMRAKYSQTNDVRFQPSVRIYNTLIDSHKLNGDGLGAERVLRRMIHDFRNGNAKAEPTTVSFNTVMTAFVKSNDRHLPQKVVKFNDRSLPQKVENILHEMEKLASSEGWDCRPNTWTYSIVLEAWASLHSVRGAERAEEIFRGLQKYYESTGDERIRPNNICYNTCMNAWAKSGSQSAPEKATELFNEMVNKYEAGDEKLKPSRVSYTAILTAWSRSQRLDSSSRALAILNEMDDRYRLDPERNAMPEAWHYSAVIDAFAAQGDVESAEAVFDRLVRNQDAGYPTRACWNGLLKAYARSNLLDAPERASEVVKKMYAFSDQGYGESSPDAVIYATLLEVWRSSMRENAFHEGLRCLDEMLKNAITRKRLNPDASVFRVLFRILHESNVTDTQKYIDILVTLMKEHQVQPSKALHDAIFDCERKAEAEGLTR